ncbi:MAG: rhomboid family intramembrane serine protease [Coprobacillus sp.]
MITNIYLIICAAIFIYINFINKDDKLLCALKLGAFYPPNVRDNKEYYRFFMCNFIHIDFFHFLLNGYALYDLGRFFEAILGPVPYLLLIIISMFLSAMLCYSASQVSTRYDNTITLGASGVVYGFFGAIVALGILAQGTYGALLQNFMYIILINVLYTFMNKQISKTGHLGGFIGGVLAIVILMAMQVVPLL